MKKYDIIKKKVKGRDKMAVLTADRKIPVVLDKSKVNEFRSLSIDPVKRNEFQKKVSEISRIIKRADDDRQ